MRESAVIRLLVLLGTVCGGGIAMVGWAYATFDTKEAGKERLERQDRRLERIEEKIDQLIERKAN
jgi:hypothetical protein